MITQPFLVLVHQVFRDSSPTSKEGFFIEGAPIVFIDLNGNHPLCEYFITHRTNGHPGGHH